jgi:hypothetical protein
MARSNLETPIQLYILPGKEKEAENEKETERERDTHMYFIFALGFQILWKMKGTIIFKQFLVFGFARFGSIFCQKQGIV